MKAIMYHYVRPFAKDYPNLKKLDFKDFKKQLDYFQSQFGFVNKNDFINCFSTNKSVSGIILTFDDGFSCHYDFVFKELKKRGLWGIFYIPVQPFLEHKLLDVHRTHILLAKHKSKKLFEFLNKKIDKKMFDESRIDEFKSKTYLTQKNDDYSLIFKRILNYYISYEYREKVLDKLMKKFVPNEKEILQSYYLTKKQIIEMHNAGMIIGSHTVNHPVMSRLNNQEQEFQIKKSFDFLESIIQKFHHKTFCYPYGGFHSFTSQTQSILSRENCLYSFNVEERDIQDIDIQLRPHALPRYDCNQFPHGTPK